jgi:hypothetical protein
MSDAGVSVQDVSIVVGIGDGDAEALDRATRGLRDELRRLDVEHTGMVTEPAPGGARAVDAAVVGALAVQIVPALEQLGAVVAAVRRWVGERRNRTASITIDGDPLTISGASQHNLDDLVRLYVERHAKVGRRHAKGRE